MVFKTPQKQKIDNGNTSFWSTTFTKFSSLLFFKLEIIKFNPESIQPTFRFSEEEKESPQAVILNADKAVGKFFKTLFSWINSKQAAHVLERKMKTTIHILDIKYTDN